MSCVGTWENFESKTPPSSSPTITTTTAITPTPRSETVEVGAGGGIQTYSISLRHPTPLPEVRSSPFLKQMVRHHLGGGPLTDTKLNGFLSDSLGRADVNPATFRAWLNSPADAATKPAQAGVADAAETWRRGGCQEIEVSEEEEDSEEEDDEVRCERSRSACACHHHPPSPTSTHHPHDPSPSPSAAQEVDGDVESDDEADGDFQGTTPPGESPQELRAFLTTFLAMSGMDHIALCEEWEGGRTWPPVRVKGGRKASPFNITPMELTNWRNGKMPSGISLSSAVSRRVSQSVRSSTLPPHRHRTATAP